MKSLLLLFFMIPTIVSAMDTNAESCWQPGEWANVDEPTDEERQNTLTIILEELTVTFQKIKACNIPSQHVENLLDKWLIKAQTHQQFFLDDPDRTNVDNFIYRYQVKEPFIGQAITDIENSITASQNVDNALSNLLNSLTVSAPDEELSFNALSLE